MDSSPPSFNTQAAPSSPSGCLRRFLLPPLSVIVVGVMMALLLSQVQVDVALTAPVPTQYALSEGLPEREGIAPFFTPEVQFWEDHIMAWSEEYNLDPDLIATVMQIESCGYSRAKSAAGAMGLFQVMPIHFIKKEDPYHPETNAFRGLSYLQKALKSGGSTRLALAGYNSGITRAKSEEKYWPEETKRYVQWGLGIYQDAKFGKYYSDSLEEWLSKGGAGLCSHANKEQNNKK
jgi:soluble lytic murein transglycosylase-like protein